MKKYLCIENGEKFVIEAENLKQTQEDAKLYCAEVIKELK